jgi:hypothetical protein
VISGTRFLLSSITLAVAALLINFAAAARGEEKPFKPLPAGEYAHQAAEKVTVGAKAYDNQDLTAEAFGKTNLLKYGVLPVLVVIENKRDKSLSLENLQVSLVGADNRHVASVGPDQLFYLGTDGKRNPQKKLPLPMPLPKKKNPMNSLDIVERAFSAKMLAPGDTASGFFYFEAKPENGDSIYLNGLRDARSGKEIMYFEFELKK